jgi:hypothetical protein
VYGRSYYKIVNALKLMNFAFESLSPEQAAESDAKIVITTKEEAEIMRKKKTLLDSELDKYPILSKAKILHSILGSTQDDQLTIGIDPGSRIGISVIYFCNEIESFVESSSDSTVRLVSMVLSGIESKRKVVRVGDGNIDMGRYIAQKIKMGFKDAVFVEIVNEYGTSSQNMDANRRGARDKSSARAIALRRGKDLTLFEQIGLIHGQDEHPRRFERV